MTRHLTSDEIAHLLIEDNAAHLVHLDSCAACRGEFELLDQALNHYRCSIQHWSVKQAHSRPQVAPASFSYLGVCALAALCLFVLAYPHPRHPASTEQPAMSDSALLETVSHQVSRSVPSQFAPLAVAEETTALP